MAPSDRTEAEPHQEAFRALLSRAAPKAENEIRARAAHTLILASDAEPLAAWLTKARLRRAILRERSTGAPSNKIAEAQLHRNLSRTILGSLSALWLLDGRIPSGETPDCVRFFAANGDEQGAEVALLATRLGNLEAFRVVVSDLASSFAAIGQSPSGIAPALMASNGAIALLAPYFILSRHGIEGRTLSPVIDEFLAAVAPQWRQAVRLPFLSSGKSSLGETREPGRLVLRATCCAKYACGHRGFCGTCPKRLPDDRT
ncbi:MAG: hypothetical protein KAG89_09060 [Fulvimarina manganoxydans]|uniref:hypothetical protein n=1 Tax=Fulvimarina manganoxydans TaxID=937218 RepID=UPI0023549D52|nr:hypothetical protein [Fulvimarina manganoxydans]MCK5932300.1 hypothetical protein [Fulvimarina manganoxydans]